MTDAPPGMQGSFSAFVAQQGRHMFKIEQCRQLGTLHRLTSFDLLQYTFERHIRHLMSESDWRRIDPS